jgi:hypothetical protein
MKISNEEAIDKFLTEVLRNYQVNEMGQYKNMPFSEHREEIKQQLLFEYNEDGSILSIRVSLKFYNLSYSRKSYYNYPSYQYKDEKSDRWVEVFTPRQYGEDRQYTGLEICNYKGDRWIAEIGCWFDKNRLVDYDGVFELPKVAIKALRKAGWTVPRDF